MQGMSGRILQRWATHTKFAWDDNMWTYKNRSTAAIIDLSGFKEATKAAEKLLDRKTTWEDPGERKAIAASILAIGPELRALLPQIIETDPLAPRWRKEIKKRLAVLKTVSQTTFEGLQGDKLKEVWWEILNDVIYGTQPVEIVFEKDEPWFGFTPREWAKILSEARPLIAFEPSLQNVKMDNNVISFSHPVGEGFTLQRNPIGDIGDEPQGSCKTRGLSYRPVVVGILEAAKRACPAFEWENY